MKNYQKKIRHNVNHVLAAIRKDTSDPNDRFLGTKYGQKLKINPASFVSMENEMCFRAPNIHVNDG